MTVEELRTELRDGPRLIQWRESGIIEGARLKKNRRIEICNVITGKTYLLPPRYSVVNVQFFDGEFVQLGQLLPKEYRVQT